MYSSRIQVEKRQNRAERYLLVHLEFGLNKILQVRPILAVSTVTDGKNYTDKAFFEKILWNNRLEVWGWSNNPWMYQVQLAPCG